MSTKVAFIGLGAMGLPMASNLQRKGFALTVYDIVAAPMQRLAQLGARATASIAECVRGAEIVITMLPATAHVEGAAFGSDGILANISSGAVFMDMSTIDAKGTDRIAKACTERGIGFTDCPVGRLALHAEKGESLFMVGADDAVYARVAPLLEAMGTTIYRCGPPGMGSRMKLVNNFMLLSTAEIVAESLMLGSKLGLDIDTMRKVTAGTTAQNGQFHVLMVNKVLKGDIEPGFTIDLAFKDMSLAMNAAAEQRVGLPVGAAVHAVYGAARAGRYASKDYSALLAHACDLAGVPVPHLSP